MTRELLFNDNLKLFSPEYLIGELHEHLKSDQKLRKKLNQTNEETSIVIQELLFAVEVVPVSEYSSFIKRALEVSPDEYDAPYFALALHLDIPLWSNDKKLKNQDEVKIFNTKEILDVLIG